MNLKAQFMTLVDRWFPSLRRRPLPPSDLPLGLSKDQADQVVALRTTAGWKAYSQALEAVFRLECESLLAGHNDTDQYQYRVGVVAALRRAASLPDDLARALSAREQHSDRTARPDPDTDYGFVGTPYYRDHAVARRATLPG